MKPRGLKITTTTIHGRKHGAGHPDRNAKLPESGRARARREDAREIAEQDQDDEWWIPYLWRRRWW